MLASRPCLATVAVLASLAIACTKSESGTAPTASTTAEPSASVAPATTPAATESAALGTTEAEAGAVAVSASAATTATGGAKKDGSAGTSGSVAPAGSAAAECGTKPLPDCPLQAWMKANVNPAVSANDLPALATAFDKISTFAPADYKNWSSIAKDGARAARGGDMTAAKASCRTCHDQYKQKYKTEMRGRKI